MDVKTFFTDKREHLRADYEIVADITDDYKPLGPNEGRTGYFHVCKEGEMRESRKDLEVFNYEGTFNPIFPPR